MFWVGLLLVCPGESRASVGVDCFVPCPPSVAPRIGFRVYLGFRVQGSGLGVWGLGFRV